MDGLRASTEASSRLLAEELGDQSMFGNVKTIAGRGVNNVVGLFRHPDPIRSFHSDRYLRHNARRLEHLASLGLPVAGRSVLEVGAGIGDHSHYYLDRTCAITITDARAENLRLLRQRYPTTDVRLLDMDAPDDLDGVPFDVIHCYGLLYHLSKPKQALAYLARWTSGMLLLETCVSFGEGEELNPVDERRSDPTQSITGAGCRPTRGWVFSELQRHFDHVYVPTTQPCHEEFPLDWTAPELHRAPLQRAIFIASREPLESQLLVPSLVDRHVRQAYARSRATPTGGSRG